VSAPARDAVGRPQSDVFLHIGMHKTGSTFLQREVFPRLPGVHAVVRAESSLAGLWKRPVDRTLLISDEGLCGIPWSVPVRRDYSWHADRVGRLQSAAKLFPNARVIVFFRRHADFILSLYKQYLHEGGSESLERFFSLNGNTILEPEELDYRRILALVHELLDPSPLVFTYDELRGVDEVVGRITSFMGTPCPPSFARSPHHNQSVRGRSAKVLRQLNAVTQSPMNPQGRLPLRGRVFRVLRLDPRTLCQQRLGFLGGADIDFRQGDREAIEARFADDWQAILEAKRHRPDSG